MRYRLMATYLGVPYHAGLGPDGSEATLFSPAPPPDELGFTAGIGHWRKQVSVTDLDALWQSRLVGEYRGEPCLILDDLGDRLHIAYLGRDSTRARQLGYWEIDREVFEVVVARQEVAGLTEERVEYPPASAMFPPSNRDPVPAAALPRPEGPGRGAPAPHAAGGAPPSASERTSPLRAVPRTGPMPAAEPGRFAEADRGASTPDRVAAWHGSPETEPWSEPRPGPRLDAPSEPWPGPQAAPAGGRRAGRRDRVPQSVFAELLSLAAIPHAAYAVDKEVPGAMCLVKADGGFEVFSRTDDARLDVRFFEDEEAAYFYLFGVLAAEAVRSGRLRPCPPNGRVNGSRGPGVPAASGEKLSKYLRREKLPKSASRTVIV
jgi:hypothetical protein